MYSLIVSPPPVANSVYAFVADQALDGRGMLTYLLQKLDLIVWS